MPTGEQIRLIRQNAAAVVAAQTRADDAPLVLSGGLEVRTGTAVWNPASAADSEELTTTVNVTGAVVGDAVAAGFSVALPAGVLMTAAVTSAGVVTVTLLNETGGAVDLASGTLRVQVFHQTA